MKAALKKLLYYKVEIWGAFRDKSEKIFTKFHCLKQETGNFNSLMP